MLVDSDHIIIGTAGHIDHGKTTLVKAITGYDADTLAEEKRRGITIELGFAFWNIPNFSKQIVFIDVPGHEKLVKTMVAGASSIDAALLVIAADEGINVQTLEHFDILQLLGISYGVIAITKSDLVNSDRIQDVTDSIKKLVSGTFLENAPIISVSSVTLAGVDNIKKAILDVANNTGMRSDNGIFRMPIDRAFAMQGFGAVVAGTILSGSVRVGDKIDILPDGLTARVRGIQVHSKDVKSSKIGSRTAINLQDVKKEQLKRGQCACSSGAIIPTNRIDAELHLLKSYGEDFKNRTRVRFHVGTDEVIGRVVLLNCDKMLPGQTEIVQFVLENQTVAVNKDRFVIRTFSSMKTIGGGIILDAQANRHKRFDESVDKSLKKLIGDRNEIVEQIFVKSGYIPLTALEVSSITGESEDDVRLIVESLLEKCKLKKISSSDVSNYISIDNYNVLEEKMKSIIADYYSRNPYKFFMPVSDLMTRFCKIADKQVFSCLVSDLAERGIIRKQKTKVGLSNRIIVWKPGEKDLAEKIEKTYIAQRYSTMSEDDMKIELHADSQAFEHAMTALIDSGRLVRLGEKVVYFRNHFLSAKALVTKHIEENGSITAAELRDKMGVTRKYSITLLEYLDNIQVTRRLGDKRVLK